jgi:hypothetical protein
VAQWNPGKKAEYEDRVDYAAPRTVDVDGDTVADVFEALMARITGHKSGGLHTEADALRTGGHEIAGELLEMIVTARDQIMTL